MERQLRAVVAFYTERGDENLRLEASALRQLEHVRTVELAARLVEAEPSLLGASHHQLVVARRAADA